jgi:hypothetical protein
MSVSVLVPEAQPHTVTCYFTFDNELRGVYINGEDRTDEISDCTFEELNAISNAPAGDGCPAMSNWQIAKKFTIPDDGKDVEIALWGLDWNYGTDNQDAKAKMNPIRNGHSPWNPDHNEINGGFLFSCSSTDSNSMWNNIKSDRKIWSTYSSRDQLSLDNLETAWYMPKFDDSKWLPAVTSSSAFSWQGTFGSAASAACNAQGCEKIWGVDENGKGQWWTWYRTSASRGRSGCGSFRSYASGCEIDDADWSSGLNMEEGCTFLVDTDLETCDDYCTSQGTSCIRGQDNIKDTCDLDSRNLRADKKGSTDVSGCGQAWKNQVCVCYKIAEAIE